MNETIEKLLEIQGLDGQIQELTEERDKRPAELKREQEAVESGRGSVGDAEKLHKEAQSGVDRLNTLLMRGEEDIKKFQLQVLAPKITNKEYQAIQNEIASKNADNSLIEEQILEGMEEVDRLGADVDAARRDLAGHEAALADAERRVETEVGQFNRQIEELDDERKAKLESLPLEVVQVYERVHQARGASVVAPVSEGFCQGCYMTVTMQDVALILRGDKIKQCKTCQRILYVPNPADWIGEA